MNSFSSNHKKSRFALFNVFLNALKISWRVLLKYKVNTTINMVGLIASFTATILILAFITHELSFDNFHEDGDRIFRVNSIMRMADGQEITAPFTNGKIPKKLLDETVEVQNITRFFSWEDNQFTVNNTNFNTKKHFWVDSSFFKIFSFQLISGDKNTCLTKPNTIVLTETLAKKMFGSKDPLLKSILVDGNSFIVTGVMKDVPLNSHIQFESIGSFTSVESPQHDITMSNGIGFTFYLKLREGVKVEAYLQKFKPICDRFITEKFGDKGLSISHSLQPLNKIHLYSKFNHEYAKVGDINSLYVFGFLAILIIFIASINYINLMTVQSEIRMRESGLRKVMGADRNHMISQFLVESLIICIISFVFALALADLLITPFNTLMDVNLQSSSINNRFIVGSMIVIAIVTSIISGLYPAYVTSSSSPASILRGDKAFKATGLTGRFLVSFQFAITVFLIISVILINLQLNYVKHKELGFKKENLIAITDISQEIRSSYKSLRNDLLSNPLITNVTAGQSIPGLSMNIQNCYEQGKDSKTGFIINENRIKDYYLETLGMKIVAGRDFDPEIKSDSASYIINETAAKKLGFKNPIGKKIYIWDHLGTIIGMVSDFHFSSMHKPVEPIVITKYMKWFNMVIIRHKPGETKAVINFLEKTFKEIDPNYTFTTVFPDQNFAMMYQKEEKLNDLITAGSILAIIISVMGLFALSAFTVRRRIKELGIRKTMGATVNQLLLLLSKKILVWLIPGILIAFPLSWMVIESWLGEFAYRISLVNYWWVWIISAVIAIIVGFLAVFYQSWKAARINPIECLKYE